MCLGKQRFDELKVNEAKMAEKMEDVIRRGVEGVSVGRRRGGRS